MKQNITAFPKKIFGFFQRHFYLTLGLVVGIWWLSSGTSDYPIHYKEFQTASYDYMEVAEESMMASDSVASPRMMKSMTRGVGGGGFIPEANADFAPEQTDRKLVKNASLTIEVQDTEYTKIAVEKKIQEIGGFVTNLNSWETRPGVLSYTFTLRIPVEKLDTTLAQMTELGSKKSENFSVTDITAQYTDNEARIKNLEIRRDRLRTMMDRKTENLNDVLQIDRELSSVQNQIENLERTQRRNDNNVSYSTLNLTLQPEPQIGDIDNPEWTPTRSWKRAVNKLITSFHHIADRVIMAVVYAPIWIPIVLVLWFIKRRFFRK